MNNSSVTDGAAVIKSAVDAFGTINAGHAPFHRGELVARNVLKLTKGRRRAAGESVSTLASEPR